MPLLERKALAALSQRLADFELFHSSVSLNQMATAIAEVAASGFRFTVTRLRNFAFQCLLFGATTSVHKQASVQFSLSRECS